MKYNYDEKLQINTLTNKYHWGDAYTIISPEFWVKMGVEVLFWDSYIDNLQL